MADGLTAENAESGRYRDTYLMKQLQNATPGGKQLPLRGRVDGITPAEVAELLHLMQQRNLIRTHTLRPEISDIKGWLDDLLTYYAAMKDENTLLAEVFCDPDPNKLERYVLAPNFYDPEDAPIRAVRSLASGRVIGPVALTSTASSAYGRALVAGLEEVQRLAAGVE
jgi:hypothetical protein